MSLLFSLLVSSRKDGLHPHPQFEIAVFEVNFFDVEIPVFEIKHFSRIICDVDVGSLLMYFIVE